MLMIIKQRIESAPVRFLRIARFYPCDVPRNEAAVEKLTGPFRNQRLTQVQLFRRDEILDETVDLQTVMVPKFPTSRG